MSPRKIVQSPHRARHLSGVDHLEPAERAPVVERDCPTPTLDYASKPPRRDVRVAAFGCSTRCVSRVRMFAGEGVCALPAFSMIVSTQDRYDSIGVLRCPSVRNVDTDLRLAAVQADCKGANGLTSRIAYTDDPIDARDARGRANLAWNGIGNDDRTGNHCLGSTQLSGSPVRRRTDDLETVDRAAGGAVSERLPRALAGRLPSLGALSSSTRMRNLSRSGCFHSSVDATEETVRTIGTLEDARPRGFFTRSLRWLPATLP